MTEKSILVNRYGRVVECTECAVQPGGTEIPRQPPEEEFPVRRGRPAGRRGLGKVFLERMANLRLRTKKGNRVKTVSQVAAALDITYSLAAVFVKTAVGWGMARKLGRGVYEIPYEEE